MQSKRWEMQEPIYLDYQATTPCDGRVVQTMLPYFSHAFGNANSDHFFGQEAANAVAKARNAVAASLGVSEQEIIFTSGATESNNLAIQGSIRHLLDHSATTARQVITVATEHKTVLETVEALRRWGIDPCILPVTAEGLVDPDQLREALKIPTLLVSIMAVNNETGIVQDIAGLSTLAHEYGALFHCDMAQAFGKLDHRMMMAQSHIDLASLSGHKIYAPKGIGVLYVRRKPRIRLAPLFQGGYQERGMRPGTLSVPLIVGMGKASMLADAEYEAEAERLGIYRNRLLDSLHAVMPEMKINGFLQKTLPGCVNLCFPTLRTLDLFARIPHLCLSAGSACTRSFLAPSYVLTAMGVPEAEAMASFRLSFGRMTTEKDVERVVHDLSSAVRSLLNR